MRLVTQTDLQSVLLFFGNQAAEYFAKHRTLPPACILVWLHEEKAEISGLHQFPTEEVASMLTSEQGKMKLATAIQAMLNPDAAGIEVPSGPRPDAVVQVLLACDAKKGLSLEKEAILMLVHTQDATHAVAVPVDAADGRADLPKTFDVAAALVPSGSVD